MTDSSIETESGDGAFEVGASTDELFGEFADETLEGGDSAAESTSSSTIDAGDSNVEDRTAADVFDQLRADAGADADADEILTDESPEDIIASADEPDPEAESAFDDDLSPDDDELAELLLTERTKSDEFLWVASESNSDGDDSSDSVTASGSDREIDSVWGAESTASATDGDVSWTIDETEPLTDAESGPSDGSEADGAAPASVDSAGQGSDADTEADATTDAEDASTLTDGVDEPETHFELDADADSESTSDTVDDETDASEADAPLESVDEAEAEAAGETALVTRESGDVPASTEDGEGRGLLGWLRSTLGGLFGR